MHYPVAAIIAAACLAYLSATLLSRRVAAAGFPLPPDERRIGCIDGLRGYLALSVLVYHAIIWTQLTRLGGSWSPPQFALFKELGAGSVALFFMVTGLLFYPRIKAGLRQTSWVRVGISRMFRLGPLLVASLLLITLISALITGHFYQRDYGWAAAKWVSGHGQPPLMGFTNSARLNAEVLWSIWYEWLFYLCVLPACALATDLLQLARLPAVIVPVGLLIVGVTAWEVNAPPGLAWYLPLFASGMLAYECQEISWIRHLLSSPVMSAVAGSLLLVTICLRSDPYSATALLPFAFFFACVACGNSFGGTLKTKGALVLGEVSFGMYLLHGLVLYLLFTAGDDVLRKMTPGMAILLVTPVAALLAVLLSSGAYLSIERPGMQLGSMLSGALRRASKRRGKPADVIVTTAL